MADVDRKMNHNVPEDVMRKRLEELAHHMSQKYGLSHSWNGNICQLSGAALKKGEVCFTTDTVSIELTLGFMAKMFKGQIDEEVGKWMDKMITPV